MNAETQITALPTAIRGLDGANEERLYRGVRSNSRANGYQFWSPSQEYAAAYSDGEVVCGALREGAAILNLIEADCCDEDCWYVAEKLETLLAGLPAALRMESDAVISRDQLWDVAGDDLSALADLLANNGYDGMRWLEGNGSDEALLLIVR